MWEHHTGERDGGYWHTPNASDAIQGNIKYPEDRLIQKGNTIRRISKDGKDRGLGLARQVKWPTPRNRMTGAATPNRSTDKFNNLESVVARRIWPTPNVHMEHHGGTGYKASLRRQELGKQVVLDQAIQIEQGHGGQLNPDWVEWLMGWPIGWTDLRPLEMDKFQKWLEQHGKC